MATAIFYSFSKRKNSTKVPTGSGDSYDVTLKSGTSLLSPTLLLQIGSRPDYNYLSFEGRYYFVTDIVSVRNNLWEISCNVDALASWKSAIGATTANILYATGGRDDIIDQRIPVESDVHIASASSVITGFTITDATPTIVLSIVGKGSFGDYIMSVPADLRYLLYNSSAYTLSSINQAEDWWRQITAGGSYASCLKNCIGLPIVAPTGNCYPATQLYLGDYPCTDPLNNPMMGMKIKPDSHLVSGNANVSIPWRFNAGDWRRYSPYSKVYLYVPFVGMLTIASNDIVSENSLDVHYEINITSGDFSVQIQGGDSHRQLIVSSGNIAMAMTYGSSNVSMGKVTTAIGVGVASVGAVALGAVTGGSAVLALGSGLTASASGLINALGGETTGGGGGGGGASQGLNKAVQCWTVSRDLTDTPAHFNAIIGKPVMQKTTVGSYSGYIQTDGMCVAGSMTEAEHDLINSACDRGIYYE